MCKEITLRDLVVGTLIIAGAQGRDIATITLERVTCTGGLFLENVHGFSRYHLEALIAVGCGSDRKTAERIFRKGAHDKTLDATAIEILRRIFLSSGEFGLYDVASAQLLTERYRDSIRSASLQKKVVKWVEYRIARHIFGYGIRSHNIIVALVLLLLLQTSVVRIHVQNIGEVEVAAFGTTIMLSSVVEQTLVAALLLMGAVEVSEVARGAGWMVGVTFGARIIGGIMTTVFVGSILRKMIRT